MFMSQSVNVFHSRSNSVCHEANPLEKLERMYGAVLLHKQTALFVDWKRSNGVGSLSLCDRLESHSNLHWPRRPVSRTRNNRLLLDATLELTRGLD